MALVLVPHHNMADPLGGEGVVNELWYPGVSVE